jgi:DNA-directed RNA polymerase specialized sigma24 family protein
MDAERAAFRELHAARLHGFALLLTLGDGHRAAWLASAALDSGTSRTPELRHPERAAAWLRARVLDAHHPARGRSSATIAPERLIALDAIGVDERVATALAALDVRERATLIADQVERFNLHDTGTIVGRNGRRLAALMTGARRRYADSFVAQEGGRPGSFDGPLGRRIRAIAARALP